MDGLTKLVAAEANYVPAGGDHVFVKQRKAVFVSASSTRDDKVTSTPVREMDEVFVVVANNGNEVFVEISRKKGLKIEGCIRAAFELGATGDPRYVARCAPVKLEPYLGGTDLTMWRIDGVSAWMAAEDRSAGIEN
jgi:hypothetical protein